MAEASNNGDQEGYNKLYQELEYLRNVKRKEISQRLAEARAMGDLSENAEYDAAKEAQAQTEAKIAELEDKLARAEIIKEEDISLDKVRVGVKVEIADLDKNTEFSYIITSEEEANYEENKIGVNSPVAKALLGRQKGDKVEVKVPAGTLRYLIKNISLP